MKRLKQRPFALLGINSDGDREKLKGTLKKHNINWRSWWDQGSVNGPIQTLWQIKQRPAIYVLDHKGIIRYKDVMREDLDRAVEMLLKEVEGSARDGQVPKR